MKNDIETAYDFPILVLGQFPPFWLRSNIASFKRVPFTVSTFVEFLSNLPVA